MKLPETVEVRALGLDPARIKRVEALQEEAGSAVYRVEDDRRSFILKSFGNPEAAIEVRAYDLLAANGVPTLPVHGRSESALLLEDLSTSRRWRAAGSEDMERGETGAAVAEWYLALHEAGRKIVARGAPDFLGREIDGLDAGAVLEIGRKLSLSDHPVWALAAEHIESLTRAFRCLPETLNYNDFHWSNLALSREVPLRAIVFDYHLMGLGPAYCDCRNATGSLGEEAKAAFWETYGRADEREMILDAPLSVLVSLHAAVALPRFPRWAKELLERVRTGELEGTLRRALEVV
jgi:hypothetical protein